MIAEEIAPPLPRLGVGGTLPHGTRDGPFGNVVTEHEQLTVNPWCSPRGVLGGHVANQSTDFGRRRGASRPPATGLPSPIPSKAFAMPANNGVGPDDDQDIPPSWPQAAKRYAEDTIGRPHPWSRPFGREDRKLLAERQVLDQEIGSRSQERSEPPQDRCNSLERRGRMDAGRCAVNEAPEPVIAV